MKRKVRMKRKAGDESPIPAIMQNYVKAVVESSMKAAGVVETNAQLAVMEFRCRAYLSILVDVKASVDLAVISSASPKETLRELLEHLSIACGENLATLQEIDVVGIEHIDKFSIHPRLLPQNSEDEATAIAQLMDDLRSVARHERGPDGDEFSEQEDMIESAMLDVDATYDLSGGNLRRGDEVRGPGGTRSSQRRRRAT